MPVATSLSVDAVRARYPSLQSGFAFMDNAGGSQVPGTVADAVRDYILTNYVQLGASYPASQRATEIVAGAHEMVNTMFNGEGLGKVIFGSSSSALLRMLSDCYAEILGPGDEVIVAETGHEANVFPWVVLANRGVTVKLWEGDPQTGQLYVQSPSSDLAGLDRLLTPRTRLVAFPQVSNILGAIEDVEGAVEAAHAVGARVVLDSVAYAPHAALDVAQWRVDFCVFSCYKVFGPHMGALWGSNEALGELTGRNHPFIPKEEIPRKFELGGALPEGCAGLMALPDYFRFLAGEEPLRTDDGTGLLSRRTLERAFAVAEGLEEPLVERFLAFLQTKPSVRIIGPGSSGGDRRRVGTISFLHDTLQPKEIVDEVDRHEIGIRHGNFYSWRLMERLGIPPAQGVARVSFAHYNSSDEVDRLIQALDPIL